MGKNMQTIENEVKTMRVEARAMRGKVMKLQLLKIEAADLGLTVTGRAAGLAENLQVGAECEHLNRTILMLS